MPTGPIPVSIPVKARDLALKGPFDDSGPGQSSLRPEPRAALQRATPRKLLPSVWVDGDFSTEEARIYSTTS